MSVETYPEMFTIALLVINAAAGLFWASVHQYMAD